jgi:hypothetical protein
LGSKLSGNLPYLAATCREAAVRSGEGKGEGACAPAAMPIRKTGTTDSTLVTILVFIE